jgi:hypothetical protein
LSEPSLEYERRGGKACAFGCIMKGACGRVLNVRKALGDAILVTAIRRREVLRNGIDVCTVAANAFLSPIA